MTNVKVKCSLDFIENFSGKIIKMAATDKDIAIDEHEATEQTPKQIDYRYIGADPNNYVCLKDNNQECSEDELYRIIGVIPTQSSADGPYEYRLKLVKYKSYEGPTAQKVSYGAGKGYSYSGSSDIISDWTKSILNTEILNKEYYESITDYQKYIEKAKWYLGVIANINTLNNYAQERGKAGANDSKNLIYYIDSIGLMYASDYGFATSGDDTINRNDCLNAKIGASAEEGWSINNCGKFDWLYGGNYYSILLNTVSYDSRAMMIHSNRHINSLGLNEVMTIKPTFYLKFSVKYLSGTGEQSNPYRITLG